MTEIAEDNELNFFIHNNTTLFSYPKNPELFHEAETYITLAGNQTADPDDPKRIIITLTISIISHPDHMKIAEAPALSGNRNDLIACILIEKFNGRGLLGSASDPRPLILKDRFILTENTEGTYDNGFLYRKLVFTTRDLNPSVYQTW